MPDLVARGTGADQHWRRTLPERPIRLGRTSKSDWEVPWDKQISGLHATLQWKDGKLIVRKEPSARNQVFLHGEASEEFRLAVGDQFVIGETTFTLQRRVSRPHVSNPLTPISELDTVQPPGTGAGQVHRCRRSRIEGKLAALPGIIIFAML